MHIFRARTLLWLSAICFLVSLALPAIVYKPDTLSNPKFEECSIVEIPDYECLTFSFDGSGTRDCRPIRPGEPREVVDRQEILDYCEGYDAPVASSDYGIFLYFFGWMGMFIGMFAWLANITGMLAFLFAASLKKYVSGLILSGISILIGLQSFFFWAKPKDEGVSHWFEVDHLGVGFYLWEASFALILIYCLVALLRKSSGSPEANSVSISSAP